MPDEKTSMKKCGIARKSDRKIQKEKKNNVDEKERQ